MPFTFKNGFGPTARATLLSRASGFSPQSLFTALAGFTGVDFLKGTQVALEPYTGTTRLAVWTQLARGVWARCRYDLDDATLPISRRMVHVVPTMALYRAKDMTQTGAWNAYANTSSSGSNARSVGNTSIATSTAGRKITQVITPLDSQPYDVYVAITQRTAGGFMKPYIDGAQTLLSANVVDPQSLGFKAISCYGSVDNTHRILTKLASGLTGTHTIELECVAGVPTGSSASGTGSVTVEAVLATSELDDPKTRPLHWAPGQVVAIGDEREYAGRFYCCSVSGTTGETPPTHTSSTASDGGATWHAAGTTYASGWIDVCDIDYSSEVESAITTLVHSAITYDVGGQTHGNEFATNRSIKLDGVTWTWNDAATITFGTEVSITEDITWKTALAGTLLASGTRETIINAGRFRNHKEVTAASGITFTIAVAYGAMQPIVRWDGFWRKDIFTKLLTPTGTEYSFDNFGNTTQSLGQIYAAATYGDCGVVGRLVEATAVYPEAVKDYENTGASARCAMNLQNLTPPPSAGTDWQAKLYFARTDTTAETVNAGDTLVFKGEQRLTAG